MSESGNFDDFEVKNDGYSTNPIISNILTSKESEVEAYKRDFDEQLEMSDNPKDELTQIVSNYIQAVGDANLIEFSPFKAYGQIAIDAWSLNGDQESTTLDLFITIYQTPDTPKINDKTITNAFNKLINFYSKSKDKNYLEKFDRKEDAYRIASIINTTNNIDKLRLFLITNAIAPFGYDDSSIELEDGTVVEEFIWDAKRIKHQDDIMSGKLCIEVDLEGDYNATLPYVKMPDVSSDVDGYLCIISGTVLAQIYHKYHQQLLEMNVRTFLQFKGTSNKGIRDTMIGHKATPIERKKGIGDSDPEPEMFFSYNNGISATATGIEVDEERKVIKTIKSLQIVNGGQTTAAIHAVTQMKSISPNSLSSVYVPMKISVIKDKEKVSSIVPKISRFANTQTGVKKSDFAISENFLVDLENKSREIWVKDKSGKPVSKWFFERTRGQYMDKAKRNATAQAQNEFFAEYPEKLMIDKATLSKFMMAWEIDPATVCRGGEKCFGAFVEKARKNQILFDELTYKRTIAKAILFKTLDVYLGKEGIAVPGYKSNLIAYLMSSLAYISKNCLNLDAIWEEQCVISPKVYNELKSNILSMYVKLALNQTSLTYKLKTQYKDLDGKVKNKFTAHSVSDEDIEALKNTLLYKVLKYIPTLLNLVNKHLTNLNEGENINEWSKKTSCWDELKDKIDKDFETYKMPEELCSVNMTSATALNPTQLEKIQKVESLGHEYLFSLHKWGKEQNEVGNTSITPREVNFIGQMAFCIKRSRKISYKQANWALQIIEKSIDRGWHE